jgi:hypothetical protein
MDVLKKKDNAEKKPLKRLLRFENEYTAYDKTKRYLTQF